MKKTVTLLFVSFFLVAAVQGQSCPTRESGLRPAKTHFSNANIPSAISSNPRLLKRAQLLTESSSTCLMLSEMGLTTDRLFAAEGVLTSVLDQLWQAEMWVDDYLQNLGYDENGVLATSLNQIFQEGQWVNESYFTVDFDPDGALLGYTQQDWMEGAWVNAFRLTITLDEFGNETQVLSEFWDGAAWVADFRAISTVDEQGLVTEVISQSADSGVWTNAFRDEYEYDESGREIVDTFSIYDEATMDWEAFDRTLTSYPDDFTVQQVGQFPSEDMGVITWVDFNRSTTTYNAQGNPLEELDEVNLGAWQNSNRTVYSYDGASNLIEEIYQNWDTNEWVNEDGFFDTYDLDNDILNSLYRLWDVGLSDWVNNSQSIYTYGDPTASENEQPIRAIALEVFPSPARERVNVNVELPGASAIQVDVYDLLGRHVVNLMDGQATGSRELFWEPAQLPAGIYFIRLQVDQQLQTRSVVVMR